MEEISDHDAGLTPGGRGKEGKMDGRKGRRDGRRGIGWEES